MRKNLFYSEIKVLLKLWITFALFVSCAWSHSAYSSGISAAVHFRSDAIAQALASSLSLEKAGVKSLSFRLVPGAIPKVGFQENQMNQESETLIFRPGKAVMELEAGDHINSDSLAMPYCLMRLRKQDRSISDEQLTLEQGPLSSDIWLPSPIRFQVNDDSVRLSFKFEELSPDLQSPRVIKVDELECHFLNENLEKANIYDVLRSVLGEYIEIAYSME